MVAPEVAITTDPMVKGVMRVITPTWALFTSYVSDVFVDRTNYIYRGQSSSEWRLAPSLDRALAKIGKSDDKRIRAIHLERLKFAARGRRGSNPAKLESENDWWALGQHNGLVTPLLDWTSSPYVAAYFAFAPDTEEGAQRRVVFALSRGAARMANAQLLAKDGAAAETLEFFRPLSDENPRLVSQGGLFTRAPDGVDIESWVQKHRVDQPKVDLFRIEIPESERITFLRNLNRMNINHLTLFPDLYGSAKYCNFSLEIQSY